MIAELGHLSLILALCTCILQACVPVFARCKGTHALLGMSKASTAATFMLLSGAFAALIYSYAVSDFSVLNVVLNSHSSKPLLYKIVGSWGNHEGSMLLWMWVLAACGLLIALLPADDCELKTMTLAVLGIVSAGFLAFILFTSNPFLRVWPIPLDGEDLNPILQDIGLAFHPPLLYVGYVGFGVVFAYAVAGLLLRRINSAWAEVVHPWILLPWSFLTLGVAAGSWWAYRELGWGGWWFWDPVENVSLLPWLIGTALIHSNMVLKKRNQLARWVVLLAMLAFTLSLIGTFIVRSGLITSVHSFAADPARGVFILAYITLISGGALLLYALRPCDASKPVQILSRSGFILISNAVLVIAAAIILLAIIYPLVLTALKLPGISVGPGYFSATFLPIMAAIPILTALAPLMAWDQTTPKQFRAIINKLLPSLAVALVIGLALVSIQGALLAISVAFGGWLVLGTWYYFRRIQAANIVRFSNSWFRHLARLMSHFGFALFILGMGVTATLKQTYEAPIDSKAPMVMGEYALRLVAAQKREEAGFTARQATFEITRHGEVVTTLSPELRYYTVRGMQTTEAALFSRPLRDIYLVLGESNYHTNKDQITLGVRLYITPGQQVLWLGFILAALGGFISMGAALFNQRK